MSDFGFVSPNLFAWVRVQDDHDQFLRLTPTVRTHVKSMMRMCHVLLTVSGSDVAIQLSLVHRPKLQTRKGHLKKDRLAQVTVWIDKSSFSLSHNVHSGSRRVGHVSLEGLQLFEDLVKGWTHVRILRTQTRTLRSLWLYRVLYHSNQFYNVTTHLSQFHI